MELDWFKYRIVPAAMSLLPFRLDSVEARAMLVAICLQESALRHRQQVGGPARGLAQFEVVACTEVMTHHATKDVAQAVLKALLYPGVSDMEAHIAVGHNDILAVVFARLLLWPDSERLPGRQEEDRAWEYYLRRWRPGKPRRAKWGDNWNAAWTSAGGG